MIKVYAVWDRRSSVMQVILVLTHSHWVGKDNNPYMEYVVYICFKISFAYFACQGYLNSSNLMVDKLMIEDTDSVCES